ncbi:hypothetical protein GCM10010341_88990 [Streptomyces noursei]|nr:hypothetical protein GCM10010341_88990 [Streptomyces noursei]
MAPEDDDTGRAAFLAVSRAESQGIRAVERLDGNVGRTELRRIADAGEGARAIGAAMELVAHTRALLLDLRGCLGGSPEGAAMWCSYFFPDDQVHLNDIYERATDSTRWYWTMAHPPAPRYLDRPVYVLTSATTFSGGEDVAYALQAHGRAVVVGETTRGGAHPTARHPVTAHLTVAVPTARTVNAVTGTDCEGVGVRPDRPVPAERALEVAYEEARRSEVQAGAGAAGAAASGAAAGAEAGVPGPEVGAGGALEVQPAALVGQQVAPVVGAGAAVAAGTAVPVVLAAGARHPGAAADVGGGVDRQHAQPCSAAGSTPAATSRA